MNIRNIVVFFSMLSLALFSHCGETENRTEIPYAIVNESINLNNFDYQPLQFIGGFANIDAGVRGIILYRESQNVYRAFERNCPFQPFDACADVSVDPSSSLFMVDSCCTSTFDFRGFPTGGPASQSMLEYNVTLAGNFLEIRN